MTGQVADWDKILITALPHTDYISFPGTEFSYSNIGYAILGAALSRVAGMPYTEYERTRVLTPLGMTHTRFEIDPTVAADLATGYQVNRDGSLDDQTAANEGRDGRGYKVPNGAIFTTVDDMSRFVSFELGNGPATVLPAAQLDAAFGGFVASCGRPLRGIRLGFHGDAPRQVHVDRAQRWSRRLRRVDVLRSQRAARRRSLPECCRRKGAAGSPGDRHSRAIGQRAGADLVALMARRIKDQTPAPGSEATMRRIVEELRVGKPNYDLYAPGIARVTRQQLPQLQSTVVALGALQSISFKGVGRDEADIYQLKFEKGSLEWRIWLSADGE